MVVRHCILLAAGRLRTLRLGATGAALAAMVTLSSCGSESLTPAGAVDAPASLLVEPVATRSVRLSWTQPSTGQVAAYRIERRANLTGDFTTLVANLPATGGRLVYFDNSVEPDTYYGYRVYAVTALGTRSPSSTVGGTKTPPPPTLVVRVQTQAPNDASLDPDGYVATVMGPRDTLSLPVANNGERRLRDIRAGPYLVFLRGLAANCAFAIGDSTRAAQVTDTGIQTESVLTYTVSCRDPQKGSVVVRYEQLGDTTDADGVRLDVSGLLDPDPADTARAYFRTERIASRNETLRFDNLRKGRYEIALAELASNCALSGTTKRQLDVRPLSLDTVRFAANCTKTVSEDSVAFPLVVEQVWSATTAPTGSKVSLTTRLDLSSRPTLRAAGLQASIQYAASALRFDSARAGDFELLTANGRTAGLVNYAAANSDASALGGTLTVGRLWFTVIGATGTSVRTATTLTTIPDAALAELKGQARIREGTLTIGTPVGGTNTPPVARANGPYTGEAGKAIKFTASGSSDVDGEIVAYLWSFGDGTTSSLDAPSKTYAVPGSYPVTLTVTDDRGATNQATTSATVTSAGGASNQPPVARITGPATATTGIPITLSGLTSTDGDGTIAAYAWSFSDGTTATGATVQKTFAASGTFTATLTVTDDKGATGVAQQSIVVGNGTGASTGPVWSSSFGTMDPATKEVILTVSLDLTADLAETPGPEALASYAVDSLTWDPQVLQLSAFNFGAGQAQSIDQSDVARGKLRFSGSTLPGQNSGVLTIARIRFKAKGNSGARTTTKSAVGPLLSTPATGSFNYRPKTDVREGTFVVP